MSIVLTQTSATQYVPKYLFVSGDCQRGTPKSRHVMKECKNPHLKLQLLPAETSLCQPVLRKRDSLRRQKQLAARSQSRVFPWLRREDIEQVPAPIDVSPPVDGGGSYDTLSDSSSRPSSPRQSQWTVGSTMGESHSSPPFTPPCSLLDTVEPTESSVNSSYNAQELVAYLHRSVICRLYDTEQSSNVNSPATIVVNHVIPRAVPARILLAISSLHRDIEVGHQTPSSVTLNLVLEGIGSLKEHLKSPSAVSDDTILAVINLWAYEVTLSIGSARSESLAQGRMLPKSLTDNIQTHLNGLRRSIECRGGLRNLSPETLWLLAWCVCTLPGYSPVDIRMMAPNVGSNEVLRTSVESSYRPSRLFETLSKIQKHVSRRQFKPNILHEASFSALRTVLLRLDVMQYALHEQRTPMNRLRKSASLVSTLLFMFDVFLEVMDSAHGGAPPHKDQLVAIQKRFVDHRIDKEGSLEKVWQVLMTQQEAPQLQLHPRSWSIVEMVNAIKHLKISTVDALSRLLLGYLLPETCDYADDVFRCEKVLLQVYFELDGLADLT
ncbi:uncharacterized protein Z520_07983 [Fonsecaea multimorphosa CBS 102226]|uniref:Transcription factor domain-containing protein n=1 Tax=Fonsecaea multimorphosa CBS 102226 TaxID=1442371 RepID=A0A0D2H2X4_9EURO|nr:uncharacterized protein Z520_07983 [Fonsecaea multimorphosa CBS 102226]KIX96205.1 hypothetical protein Z520_07983 [Fonsecaea multimorphosa CBS 102226]